MMLAYWHWIILGLCMVALEVMIPGAFFIWIGITAIIMGSIVFLFPLIPIATQLVLFGVLVLLVTVLGRKIVRVQLSGEGPMTLNRRGQQFVDETIVLDVPIVNGHAHVTVGDSKWRIKGPDLPEGTIVQVVGVEGNMLIVMKKDT